MTSQFDFFKGFTSTDLCDFQEKCENLRYCRGERACSYRSKYQIPYVNNGNVGGRAYECKKRRR